MRITKKSNIAIRTLMYCAAHSEKLVTKAEVAEKCGISVNHLAQVIHQLSLMGFLETQRGRSGGFSLSRPASAICIGDVFRAFEGAALAQYCFADADNSCPLVSMCRLRVALHDAAEAFFATLDEITLDALVCDNIPLLSFFEHVSCNHNS